MTSGLNRLVSDNIDQHVRRNRTSAQYQATIKGINSKLTDAKSVNTAIAEIETTRRHLQMDMSKVSGDFYNKSMQTLTAMEEILKTQQKQVNEKVDKCFDIKLLGQHFKIINATENVSELGNAICNKYDMPSIMFFYTSKDTVVLSLRSLDHLTDVSFIAQQFYGGGHYCAASCEIKSSILTKILSNTY
jgi:nanoRNase/pAp phosphatase (c-di-AMP/oligoRNAs hydrolase)